MEILEKNSHIEISSEKKTIVLEGQSIVVDEMKIDFPGEYEKSGILVHCLEINETLVYELRIEGRVIAYIPETLTTPTEELTGFFQNLDILVLNGTKDSTKLSELLDARIVVPYGEGKDTFLTTFGQALEPTDKFKPREIDFEGETTVFVRLG